MTAALSTWFSLLWGAAWWLSPIVLVAWGARRYLFSPWAKFVSTTKTEKTESITVKHVRWYPPFLAYNETYMRKLYGVGFSPSAWYRVSDGERPEDARATTLNSLLYVEELKAKEIEELEK